jgi:hypothetical protein
VRPRHVWLIATSALEDLEDSACALQLKRILQITEAADLDKADLKELFPSGRGLYGGCWQSGSAGSLRHNLAVKGGPHPPPITYAFMLFYPTLTLPSFEINHFLCSPAPCLLVFSNGFHPFLATCLACRTTRILCLVDGPRSIAGTIQLKCLRI